MSDNPPRTPLLYPRRYFEHLDDPLPYGLAVFALYVLGMSVLAYATFQGVVQHVSTPHAGVEQQLSGLVFTILFFAAIVACIALLIVAAVMHYGCGRTTDDSRAFRDAVAVAGWAYAPNALSLPVSYLLVRRRLRELGSGASSPEALEAELQAVQTPTGIKFALTLTVIVWSVYILAYGTAETHDADLIKTFFLATIVGVFALIWSFI